MKLSIVCLLLVTSSSSALGYQDAPYLGSSTSLLATTFCSKNACKLLGKAELYKSVIEETYSVRSAGDKETVIVMIIRSNGKVDRISIRNITQEGSLLNAHLEVIRFASGSDSITKEQIEKLLSADRRQDYNNAYFSGYKRRPYTLSDNSIPFGGAADRWVTITEDPFKASY